MRICRILKMHLRILLVCYLYCSVLNVKRPYLSKSSEYLCQSKDEVNTILAELAITYQNAHGQNPDWLDISTDYWHTTCQKGQSGTRGHLRPDEVGILHCRPQTVGPHIQRPLGPYWYVSSKFSLICVSNRQCAYIKTYKAILKVEISEFNV